MEDLIKKEMSQENPPGLVPKVVGNGQCLIYITPLATRPDYYIMRVDSSWEKLIKDDGDKIGELIESECVEAIDEEYGLCYWEDDDGIEQHEPFPALNESCGWAWGLIS